MDFSNKKYIKYKTKYVELKGGMWRGEYNRLENIDFEPDEKQIQRLEQLEKERLAEKERLDKLEIDRLETERLETERVKRDGLKKFRLYKERLEREKKETVERLERERVERERVAEKEKVERLERERVERERVAENFNYWQKRGDEARDKENAMKEFITVLDRIDINKNQLLEEIENVLIKDNVESKNKLLTVLKKYKQEINNKKLAINKIKEVYDYIPSDIREKMVFETILR